MEYFFYNAGAEFFILFVFVFNNSFFYYYYYPKKTIKKERKWYTLSMLLYVLFRTLREYEETSMIIFCVVLTTCSSHGFNPSTHQPSFSRKIISSVLTRPYLNEIYFLRFMCAIFLAAVISISHLPPPSPARQGIKLKLRCQATSSRF